MSDPTWHEMFDGSDASLIPAHSSSTWRIKECASDPSLYQLLDASGVVIGFPRRGTGSRAERETLAANARLIAAAPELLEALTVAREWLRGDKWRNSTIEKHASWESLMRGIDAAIAAATGATP